MRLHRLWLRDFRIYSSAHLELAADGITAVVGNNASGKTSLLEAITYLARLSSFRGAPREALVRAGAPSAVVRGEGEREGRSLLVEVELRPGVADRVLVNRQALRRSAELSGALRVTVFSPDDLDLVKGGPSERRRYLDEILADIHPANSALAAEFERVLRQRNALLRQCAGRLDADAERTLDVWDSKLAASGEALGAAREEVVGRLEPEVVKAYDQVAATGGAVSLGYVRSWEGSLATALAAGRTTDVRRGVTGAGPQRDDVALSLVGRPARTQASQGEQRSLALALRLAAHAVVHHSVGEAPILLLDDVFSELDPGRCAALLAHLPPGQAVLTAAGEVPAGARLASRVRVHEGRLG